MEDVIFGGTQKRAAGGLRGGDACARQSAPGSSGIETPMRSPSPGGITAPARASIYINRQSARLRDINELLMDTGLGKEGYSNIGQGKDR